MSPSPGVRGAAEVRDRDFAVVDVRTSGIVSTHPTLGDATKAMRPGQRVKRLSSGSWMTMPLAATSSSDDAGNAARRRAFGDEEPAMRVGDEVLDADGLEELAGG